MRAVRIRIPENTVNFDLVDDTTTAQELLQVSLQKLNELADNESDCWPRARTKFFSLLFKASSEYLSERLLQNPEKDLL